MRKQLSRKRLLGLVVVALAAGLAAPGDAEARKRRSKKTEAMRAAAKKPPPEEPTAKPAAAKPEPKPAPKPHATLIIGTKPAPPFSMQDEEGNWRGISIHLWRQIAKELGFKFKFRKQTLTQLISEAEAGTLDASVAALTITAARESKIDFTHPFYTSGLGIAVRTKQKSSTWAFIKRIFSIGMVKVLAALLALLALVGLVIWFFERRRNAKDFGGSAAQGIGNGLWFSAVTMTTVGYGDKAPVTLGGRLVGLVWMFASIIIISSFTATITTTLTVSRLESSIQSPRDLAGKKVGTVPNSTSAAYLKNEGIAVKYYPTVLAALQGVGKGEVDAAVYDAPIMKYLAKQKLRGKVRVLPVVFERQDYGIALPNKSPLREEINRVLLKLINSSDWRTTTKRYLGE